MRYEFNDENIHIKTIRPDAISEKEKRLAKQFIIENPVNFNGIEKCPISREERSKIFLEKWNIPYAICQKSWSISMAQMPNEKLINKYFIDSELARYRESDEYQDFIYKHRSKIWDGQIDWIEGRVNRYLGVGKYDLLDYGTRWVGWKNKISIQKFVKEIYFEATLPPITEKIPSKKVDLVLMNDVLQRSFDIEKTLNEVASRLKSKGLLIVTVRSGSGFDILTLKNEASIYPLDHIILPSPEGMELLMQRNGFEIMEISTPGLLDIEYVEQKINIISDNNPFIKYLLTMKNEKVKEDLQSFLQRNNLSSHIRLVARKKV